MGFRTLEIRRPAELHVTMGQLNIEQEEGIVTIPLEDLTTIVCIGSNIRLSTLGMAQMARCGITVLMIDTTYKPAAVLLPVESNARQALVVIRYGENGVSYYHYYYYSITIQSLKFIL